jgi:hypothetical protein
MAAQIDHFDQNKLEDLQTKVGDVAGSLGILLAYMGDQLNLYAGLAAICPATSQELAAKTGPDRAIGARMAWAIPSARACTSRAHSPVMAPSCWWNRLLATISRSTCIRWGRSTTPFDDRMRANSLSQEVGLTLGAQAGQKRLTEVLNQAGFQHVRRAAETDTKHSSLKPAPSSCRGELRSAPGGMWKLMDS